MHKGNRYHLLFVVCSLLSLNTYSSTINLDGDVLISQLAQVSETLSSDQGLSEEAFVSVGAVLLNTDAPYVDFASSNHVLSAPYAGVRLSDETGRQLYLAINSTDAEMTVDYPDGFSFQLPVKGFGIAIKNFSKNMTVNTFGVIFELQGQGASIVAPLSALNINYTGVDREMRIHSDNTVVLVNENIKLSTVLSIDASNSGSTTFFFGSSTTETDFSAGMSIIGSPKADSFVFNNSYLSADLSIMANPEVDTLSIESANGSETYDIACAGTMPSTESEVTLVLAGSDEAQLTSTLYSLAQSNCITSVSLTSELGTNSAVSNSSITISGTSNSVSNGTWEATGTTSSTQNILSGNIGTITIDSGVEGVTLIDQPSSAITVSGTLEHISSIPSEFDNQQSSSLPASIDNTLTANTSAADVTTTPSSNTQKDSLDQAGGGGGSFGYGLLLLLLAGLARKARYKSF